MQLKILLVEDNHGYTRLIQEMLVEADDSFVLKCASRLSTGLEMLAAEAPDAVILDLSLPDSHGLATFSKVHDRAPNLPIVVLSGLSDEEVAVQAVRSGAQDFLLKSDITAGSLARSLRYGIERKRAEVVQAHLAAIVQSSADAIIGTTSDDIISSWNPGAERMFGYPAAEALGEPVSILVPPDRALDLAISNKLVQEGKVSEHLETVGLGKDGKRIYVSLSVSPLKNATGRIVGASRIYRDITDQKRIEDELCQLSAYLLEAQDEERRRIARDLHDSTAQSLAAISINLGLLARNTGLDKEAQKRVADSATLAKQCSDEIRNVSYLLHPPLLDELGLASAVHWYAEGFAQRSGIRVDLQVSSELGRLPKEAETALFRIVQEGLMNVHRHSGSGTATVRIVREFAEVKLEIEDEGRGMAATGIEMPNGERARPGVGISGMRERLRHLGGELEIDSSPQGTTVKARLPLRKVIRQ